MLKNVKKLIDELKQVLKEISWSDKKSLIQLTIMVTFVSVVISLILGGADYLFTKLISWTTLK